MEAGNKSVQYYKSMFANMKTLRSNFDSIYIDVDKYVYGFLGSYDSNPIKGQFTYENVYDHTAFRANTDATNALVGILWQQGGRSIKITPSEELQGDSEVEDWFKKTSDTFVRILDDPNSRMTSALTEYMESVLSHGTSGVGVFRGSRAPLAFKSYNVRTLYFEDDENGFPSAVALRSWLMAYQAVEKYGAENVSPKTLKDAESPTQRTNEVEIVQFIHPNLGADAEDKPYLSVHVDMQNNHILKDSYYEELQVKVGRLYKTSFETYGRSPAINVLSDIKRSNSVKGDTYQAIEKLQEPSLGIHGDATAGNGVIDLSAGAINMFNTQAVDGSPIFPISTVGDIQPSFLMMEQLRASIRDAYSLSQLMDVLNEPVNTATQAMLIDRLRNTSIGALLTRQINEVFTPTVETAFNLLFNDGVFGVIEGSEQFNIDQVKQQLTGEPFEIEVVPEKIAKLYNEGKSIYTVEYLTPAARMLASEEANNIVEATGVLTQMAQSEPAILDNVDGDKAARKFVGLKGLQDILKSEDDVQEVRDERLKMQQQQAQAQQEQQQAQTMATVAQAEGALSE